jgi:hypothetical protein
MDVERERMLMVAIVDHAGSLAANADVGHRWQEGMCACGVSECSVSDEGVCTEELSKLLIRMAGFVMANYMVYEREEVADEHKGATNSTGTVGASEVAG